MVWDSEFESEAKIAIEIQEFNNPQSSLGRESLRPSARRVDEPVSGRAAKEIVSCEGSGCVDRRRRRLATGSGRDWNSWSTDLGIWQESKGEGRVLKRATRRKSEIPAKVFFDSLFQSGLLVSFGSVSQLFFEIRPDL